MKKITGENYRQRLIKVIDYIHEHLNEDLDVNTLADIALMSPYHFHRIYRELVQETVNGTVRRLRLQRAAADLIRTDLPILTIAKQVSYGSLEAFTRAFTKSFGTTPAAYRASRQYEREQAALEPFIAILPPEQKRYSDMYTVEIVDNEDIHLVGYHHKGDYMEIGSVFEKLFIYGASKNLIEEDVRSIGLYFDDPKSVDVKALRSMACATLDKNILLEGDDAPERISIPKGKCATLLFKGPYAELEKPYDWLFGEWLPNSGYEAEDFPPFEEYLNDPKETPPSELLTRIHCMLVD
jgi:AraC family transcriptional regulator